MARVHINGMTFQGNDVTVMNGRVIIDGKDVTPDGKSVVISVDGNVENLSVDACSSIAINGTCGNVKTMSGNVRSGHVNGSVQTSSGDVECNNVHGNVQSASGDIECDIVGGNVHTASGDIDYVRIGDDKSFLAFMAERAPNLIDDYKRSLEHA